MSLRFAVLGIMLSFGLMYINIYIYSLPHKPSELYVKTGANSHRQQKGAVGMLNN